MSPTLRRAVLATAIAAAGYVASGLGSSPVAEAGPTAGAETADTTTCAGATATAAKLRIQITSTAPQVDIHLRPTTITGRRVDSTGGGATTTPLLDGLRVAVPDGSTGTVSTEVIAFDVTQASTLTLSVDKVGSGSVSIKVSNSAGYGRTTSLSTSKAAAQVGIDRTRLFDPGYQLPKADDRQLVLAAYYPWFGTTGWETLAVPDVPLVPRSTWNIYGVRSMTQQAREHGVDGFVVSWMGAAKNGDAYDLAAQAALETNGVVAPYLEVPEALNNGGVPTVEQWLREALDRTGPASVTIDGVPVVFVWDMGKVSAADWSGIVTRIGRPMKLVGDADTATHGPVMQGWHRYLPLTDLTGEADRGATRSAWYRGQAALEASRTPRIHVTTVSPGYDDRLLRGLTRPIVSREGGRYDATWDAAVAADPDMILITSWNEWFEGTSIEPGVLNGDEALQTTAVRSAQWKAGPTCTASVEDTTTTTTRKAGRKG